jgi:hypothetical protein
MAKPLKMLMLESIERALLYISSNATQMRQSIKKPKTWKTGCNMAENGEG